MITRKEYPPLEKSFIYKSSLIHMTFILFHISLLMKKAQLFFTNLKPKKLEQILISSN